MVNKRGCPSCGRPERRDRCCWPMPDSPPLFFDETEWDDNFDAEILADRLGGGVLYEEDLAKLLRVTPATVRQNAYRGKVPRMLPCEADRQTVRRWRAVDVAGLVR